MQALTFFSALGSGLMAGLFFTFSNFVMKALASLPPEKGIASMQAINVSVLNPLFLIVFSGTGLACLVLIGFSILRWGQPGSQWLVAGGALYVVGVFVVTFAFNIPRNDALAALDPASAESVTAWRNYVAEWTAWNHVRTIASVAAMASLIIAFSQLRELAT